MRPKLFFTKTRTSISVDPFNFTFIDKFSYKYPKMDTIRKNFDDLKLISEWIVAQLDGKHIVIRLIRKKDYVRYFLRSFIISRIYLLKS